MLESGIFGRALSLHFSLGLNELTVSILYSVNLTLLSIFTLDVFFAIYAFGPITYATSWITLLDGFVVLTTFILDVYFHFSKDPNAESP